MAPFQKMQAHEGQILNSDAPLFLPDRQAQSPSSVLKQTVEPTPAFLSDPVGLGQSLRICSSYLLPGGADAVGPRTPL